VTLAIGTNLSPVNLFKLSKLLHHILDYQSHCRRCCLSIEIQVSYPNWSCRHT